MPYESPPIRHPTCPIAWPIAAAGARDVEDGQDRDPSSPREDDQGEQAPDQAAVER